MTAKQIDRALTVLERLAAVAERWAAREYPEQNGDEEKIETYLARAGHPNEPETAEEYEKFEPVGEFERRFQAAHPQA